jgi:RNA polymerase sigma-70 factor (ECF subfamily)
VQIRLAQVNDGPGLVATADGDPIGALVLEIADGVIQTIDLIANPDKLAGVRA